MAEVFRVHRDDPRAWQHLPELIHRMVGFCALVDAETDPEDLRDLVRVWFATGDERLGLWIAVQDGRIVAHAFATPEPLGGRGYRYVLIRQAEVDSGVDLRAETWQTFEALRTWAQKVLGVREVMMLTHRREDVFARAWGFRPYKAMMRRELNGGKPDGQEGS